ncbi:hypothetical protein CNMCM5793_008436 [Aspergillus hiratsukae]|uniref:Retroviral polymerase SH3-like domain-containing protein n=1 Tax=Aspergillus hiratsukae TaxID=1194566 RepID=A0A8H6UHB3_9EURO|nr:hypothetical protein CNMCM5793_008436 [Aspergillus hiratsukae]
MFDKHVERRYDLKVCEYHLDGERLGDKWEFYLEEVGVGERRTVPYTPEQNGPSERIGYEIVKRARAILIEANLPRQLGLEACKATIYLINRTPVRFPDSEPKDGRNESDHDCWYIPLQRFRQLLGINKPIDVSNLYKFGSLAYYRRNNIPRSHKMEPRAAIGYLIGYESYNIWRLFNPKALPAHRVFRARDVVFDESRKYDPNDPLLTTGLRYAFPEETADSNAAPEVEIPPMLILLLLSLARGVELIQ